MITIPDIIPECNISCTMAVEDLEPGDFKYFDKDGFELNKAEQKFYSAQGHNIHNGILNHYCWDQSWIEIDPAINNLYLDHSMILYRAHYTDAAAEQLSAYRSVCPRAALLLQIKSKWGFDFDLNAFSESGLPYEVLHIEYDNYDYTLFLNRISEFEQIVKNMDWQHVAHSVWQHRNEWQNLQGYDQNHWKAKHILGWDLAEYLEKALT
jgi:hypothetical protein